MRLIYLKGKIVSTKKIAAGVKLRLRDAKSGDLLMETITGKDGFYNFKFAEKKMAARVRLLKKVVLEIVDANDKVLSKKVVTHDFQSPKQVNFKLPANISSKVKPKYPEIQKVTGSIFDLNELDTFWNAMHIAYPTGMPRSLPMSFGSICPLPDIKQVPDLVDVAWDVIHGDPVAKVRMREILHMLKKPSNVSAPTNIFHQMAGQKGQGASPMSTTFMKSAMIGRVSNLGGDFGPILPVNRPCFLTNERFLPVAAASIMTARNQDEVFGHLGALEDGLCGLGRMNSMLEASTRVMHGGSPSRLQGMVGLRWGGCGPDDGPIPEPFPTPEPCPSWPEDPDLDWCFHERMDCIKELIDALGSGSVSSTTYTIDSVSPEAGCPGILITIDGENFGTDPGRVRFVGVTGGSIYTDPVTWSDTKITVIVPDHAGSGLISLEIIDEMKVICNKTFPIYRTGNGIAFDADSAQVTMLRINGNSSNITAEPGEVLTITWGATHENVSIRIKRGSSFIQEYIGLPATGTRSNFSVPALTNEETLTIEARVTSPCGTATLIREVLITVAPQLTIEGMEFTQGVQRYWRPGVVWNSIDTVAGKDTIVRVYVSCDRNGFAGDTYEVTGILHVDGTPHYPINGTSPDSSANSPDPFITARPRAEIDRQETDHTLNFRIPASRCNGTKGIRATVYAQPPVGYRISETLRASNSWRENGPLKVRFVRIRDDSQSPTVGRPTKEQCRFSIERALDLMPTPPTDIGPAWRPTWNTNEDFTGDDDDLRDLLNDLNDEHNCNAWEWLWGWTGATDCPDDDNAIWVGYSRNFNRGMGKRPGNTCISAVYNLSSGQNNMLRIKTAHEIGHNLGMKHIDVGGAGGSFYNHPNNGDLLDVPFDPFWNVTVNLSSVSDFMGYGSPRWSSADSWNRMMSSI
ncbi:IPT/TIG domain-containing protein [Maribacter sp.]|nr:IPT/TIG domain-containing protein [Maribacter sp.]